MDPTTGNDVGCLAMPFISEAVASFTGWAMRNPTFGGEARLMMVSGSTLPLPLRREDRREGDVRQPVLERYSNKREYLERVQERAERMVEERLLLREDVSWALQQAAKLWNWRMELEKEMQRDRKSV